MNKSSWCRYPNSGYGFVYWNFPHNSRLVWFILKFVFYFHLDASCMQHNFYFVLWMRLELRTLLLFFMLVLNSKTENSEYSFYHREWLGEDVRKNRSDSNNLISQFVNKLKTVYVRFAYELFNIGVVVLFGFSFDRHAIITANCIIWYSFDVVDCCCCCLFFFFND